MQPKLELGPLRLALTSLERLPLDHVVDDVHRDAAIQRFEFTYELYWKFMKRHLDWAGVSGTDMMGRRELFREAARAGLIADPLRWVQHHDARNATSHNYDEANARRVFHQTEAFVIDARYLLAELSERHA
jgi:nucleotidyltransferase substrate binding protein (TIGR01987 family)